MYLEIQGQEIANEFLGDESMDEDQHWYVENLVKSGAGVR
jgi:hypothetical protein